MTLNEIEQRLEALQAEKDKLIAELERLKAEEAQVKPWRAEYGENYYHISQIGNISADVEIFHNVDNKFFNCGNYYRTHELAEQDAKELALRGRVRQLRDALCEGYVFTGYEDCYCIGINAREGGFTVGYAFAPIRDIGQIYFDTEEHAQTACDILNAGMRKESGGKL